MSDTSLISLSFWLSLTSSLLQTFRGIPFHTFTANSSSLGWVSFWILDQGMTFPSQSHTVPCPHPFTTSLSIQQLGWSETTQQYHSNTENHPVASLLAQTTQAAHLTTTVWLCNFSIHSSQSPRISMVYLWPRTPIATSTSISPLDDYVDWALT